jgi:diacylglycerol kinase family enzyme
MATGAETDRGVLRRAVVIFNPPSTGDGPPLAEELHADLALRLPDIPVRLYPTERAGHARDIAREATQTGHPLIVSVSADGGYNEVVDGSCRPATTTQSAR